MVEAGGSLAEFSFDDFGFVAGLFTYNESDPVLHPVFIITIQQHFLAAQSILQSVWLCARRQGALVYCRP